MPQEIQIVPKYLHSHVETYINDYTTFTDEAAVEADSNVQFLCVFRSPMGPDNVLVKKSSLKDFLTTYGTSDYNKYGQPLMMPIGILSSGNATVNCMRVMPEDAFAANSVLCMLYKKDYTNGKFDIKYKSYYATIDDGVFSGSSSTYETGKAFKKNIVKFAQKLTGYVELTGEEGSKTYTAYDISTLTDALTAAKKALSESTAQDKTSLETAVTQAQAALTAAQDSHYYRVPIAIFRMSGRGAYGNTYRWRIARNYDYEKEYGIKMYTFETLSTTNGVSKAASYVGGIITSPSYKNTLTLINDILDDKEAGSLVMDSQMIEDNIQGVYDAFAEFVTELSAKKAATTYTGEVGELMDVDEFDPFFGYQMVSTEVHPNINIITIEDEADTECVSIDAAQGTSLVGGADGAFDLSVNGYDQAMANVENACYIKAFQGEYDRYILSARRTPVNALFDANYDITVKDVLAEYANTRESALLYLDCGTETTFSGINEMIAEYTTGDNAGQFNTRNISKNFQHYTTKDPSTGKKCEVTITYFLAQQLASHFKNNGSWVPFVKGYSTLSGHVKNTLEPSIDDIDMDVKETLYNNRFNYYETIAENTYERSSQNTAQSANSDLMEENNMHTLFEIKRILEEDCNSNLYNFTDASQRALFTSRENQKFNTWIGQRVASFNVSFSVNEWEAERSIVHCYASVQFRTLNKRTIIEIDVNKRNFTA